MLRLLFLWLVPELFFKKSARCYLCASAMRGGTWSAKVSGANSKTSWHPKEFLWCLARVWRILYNPTATAASFTTHHIVVCWVLVMFSNTRNCLGVSEFHSVDDLANHGLPRDENTGSCVILCTLTWTKSLTTRRRRLFLLAKNSFQVKFDCSVYQTPGWEEQSGDV